MCIRDRFNLDIMRATSVKLQIIYENSSTLIHDKLTKTVPYKGKFYLVKDIK